MDETSIVIAVLAVATLSVRLLGVAIGQRLPQQGGWAAALNALPGCLIVSLVCVMLAGGGPREWVAGAIALAVAIVSRSLPLTMVVGIVVIWMLRQFT